MKSICYRCTPEKHALLKAAAKARNLTINAFIDQCLSEYTPSEDSLKQVLDTLLRVDQRTQRLEQSLSRPNTYW